MTSSNDKSKIWIDGCFDFAHHGHAGAMRQARQLGKELYVGVHTDEDINKNKGPVVMKLPERIIAVEACKWCTKSVPGAPYVTSPQVMDQYYCEYVVHGDDITTDANGEDCYQEVKDLGRFVVVKRTPNISTTDLVGRMLLFTKTHHIPPLISENLDSVSGVSNNILLSSESVEKFEVYSTAADAKSAHSFVLLNTAPKTKFLVPPSAILQSKISTDGIMYIDGTFDLFHPGHITFLAEAFKLAKSSNIAIVVGIHDDKTVNENKGLNYPIMNMFERALCVLQCKYVDGVILGVPFVPRLEFIERISKDIGQIKKVVHGPTAVVSALNDNNKIESADHYEEVRNAGLFTEIGKHEYDDVSTEVIVKRVLDNKVAYEERQRRKGWKSEIEKQLEAEEKKKLAAHT